MDLAMLTGDKIAQRDTCMFMLAYHGFLRGSEVARMNHDDISFSAEKVNGASTLVMEIHVDRMAKNDAERLGHDRLVASREEGEYCLVRQMKRYLDAKLFRKRGVKALFPTKDGERMNMKYWLGMIGVQDLSQYGFHSLRTAGATDAHRAGVTKREIKLHGAWKSDAVELYMRPSMEDRLAASSALGEWGRKRKREAKEEEDGE